MLSQAILTLDSTEHKMRYLMTPFLKGSTFSSLTNYHLSGLFMLAKATLSPSRDIIRDRDQANYWLLFDNYMGAI